MQRSDHIGVIEAGEQCQGMGLREAPAETARGGISDRPLHPLDVLLPVVSPLSLMETLPL